MITLAICASLYVATTFWQRHIVDKRLDAMQATLDSLIKKLNKEST